MKWKLINILLLIIPFFLWSQQEYHVFPIDHKKSPGTSSGDGSIENPWDLKTVLNLSSEKVKGGDTIWLHGGTYNGRYISTIQGNIDKKINISAFKNEKVILNGNIPSKLTSVLEVKGGNVIFKNFEITFLGSFKRSNSEQGFQVVGGINHVSGEDCSFINLKIHNTPGSGIGSWKRTGGTVIEGCSIFNNGYFTKARGSGVGIYVQNQSDKIRLIKNNFIFNNYYKGVEVWSASSGSKIEFIKNVTLENNVIFNNGLPAGQFKDNLIVATNDKNGMNLAKNIKVLNNVLYHNTDVRNNQIGGDAASLTLGYNANAPLVNVLVTDNVIIGRNNALRFNNARSLIFKRNIAYCGYVHLNKAVLNNLPDWELKNNTYYTKNKVPFRISKHKDYSFKEWRSTFKNDGNSNWKHIGEFELPNILKVIQNEDQKHIFNVSVFNKEGKDVVIDFSEFNFKEGENYVIKNIETDELIVSGRLDSLKKVNVPMGTYNGTIENFGVYKIEFESESEPKKKGSFFKRVFGWLF